jgi:hypothetical protein
MWDEPTTVEVSSNATIQVINGNGGGNGNDNINDDKKDKDK